MEIDLNRTAIDLNNPAELETFLPMLANLQGNILKPHGRNLSVCLFLEFDNDQARVKRWISKFTRRYITSAARQHHEAKEFKANNISGHLFASIYLSADGYRIVGFNDLTKFDASDPSGDVRFTAGMKQCVTQLKDPDPSNWEETYQKTIHAMVLLADDYEERLQDVAKRVVDSLSGVGRVSFEEKGFVLRTKKSNEPAEHFGFRDGISQPLFFKDDINKELPPDTDVLNPDLKWNPSAPLKLVLVKDPFANAEHCFGSYLVYRKLEQNVALFLEKEAQLVAALELPDSNKDRAEALIVGRFRNGMPAMVYDDSRPVEKPNLNNFDYKHDDPNESNRTHSRCPYHAHIRKTNPRGDFILGSKIDEEERLKRIARRGINYDRRPREIAETDKEPKKDAGLLFMCFQSSISKQFAFIQTDWANNPTFPPISEIHPSLGIATNRAIGPDPILAPKFGDDETKKQTWCPSRTSDETKSFHFSDVVTLKGGEFFFAPSIFFLGNLAPILPEHPPLPTI